MKVSDYVSEAGRHAEAVLSAGWDVATVLTVVAVLSSFVLVVIVAIRRRNRRLFAEAEASVTRLLGDERPLAQVLWEHQQVGVLQPHHHRQLLDARSATEVERLLAGVGSIADEQQELAVAIARAHHVEESARFVTRGVNASVPAVDAVLSQVGGLAALLPGAALGVVQAQDALDLLGIDFDLVHAGLDAGAGALEGYADHLLGGNLPILTMVTIARKEMQMVSAGKSVTKALQHGALDVAAGAGGAFVGMKAGLVAGSLIAPGIGSAIGAVMGAFAGGMAGKSAAITVKAKPLVAANEELATAALAAMPADAEGIERHLIDVGLLPYEYTRDSADEWWSLTGEGSRGWWPTFGEALHATSLSYMDRDVADLGALHGRVQHSVSDAGATRIGAAGAALVLLNCPVEAAALGVTPEAVEGLLPLQVRAAALRAELMPVQ